jgi:hypothetical protein
MLQAGGPEFQKSLRFLMNMIWEYEIYPYDWSKALVQPIYKGDAKPRVDPASYRGIYLTCMTTTLFEGILNERLTDFTTQHDTLTPYQFGSKKGHQTHDALLATIRNNQQFDNSPTYCAFIDFSTAYPSVHRNRLTNIVVCLAVVTLQPRSTAPAVAGCRLVGYSVVSGLPLRSRAVAGVSQRVCVGLGSVLASHASSPPAAAAAAWRGRGRVPIAGWSHGGVGPERGLRGGGRRGWCEEWARRGWDHPTSSYH